MESTYVVQKKSVSSFFLNTGILFSFLLPKEYNYFIILWLFAISLIFGTLSKFLYLKIIFFVIISLPVVNNLHNFNSSLDLQRGLIFIFTLIFYPFKIYKSDVHIYLLIFIYIFIVTFQISIALEIPIFINFRDLFYPFTNLDIDPWEVGNILSNKIQLTRYGGIYRNPNMMGQYVVILFILFIVVLKEKINNISFTKYLIFILLFFVPLYLSASRISMGVFLVSSFITLKTKNKINLIIISVLIVILFLYKDSSIEEIGRVFDFSSAFTNDYGSGSIKLKNLISYIDQLYSPMVFLLGNFGTSNTFGFDSDIGELLYTYGFIGLMIIIIYYINVYYNLSKEYKFVYILLLFSFVMGVIYSLKIFIIFTIILSITNNSNQKNDYKDIIK